MSQSVLGKRPRSESSESSEPPCPHAIRLPRPPRRFHSHTTDFYWGYVALPQSLRREIRAAAKYTFVGPDQQSHAIKGLVVRIDNAPRAICGVDAMGHEAYFELVSEVNGKVTYTELYNALANELTKHIAPIVAEEQQRIAFLLGTRPDKGRWLEEWVQVDANTMKRMPPHPQSSVFRSFTQSPLCERHLLKIILDMAFVVSGRERVPSS